MDLIEVLAQVRALLQSKGRITYRLLQAQFQLSDEALAALKEELIEGEQVAGDEGGKVLVWMGKAAAGETAKRENGEKAGQRGKGRKRERGKRLEEQHSLQTLDSRLTDPRLIAGERRQLTVMFCDLVGSTTLSTQLDPEDLRAVVRRYQHTCAEVIQHHAGYIAQYLGDGVLVYFGYPTAHEDDARRAVQAGLEIIAAIAKEVPSPWQGEGQGEGAKSSAAPTPHPNLSPQGGKELRKLQVRIGLHTGLVVVGEIGGGGRAEQLAVGETPNLAARIQGLAEPNTVLISAATQRLVDGQFECQPFGSHLVKGIETPIAVYHVQSERQSASPLAGRTSLTPLVGREQEVGLLFDRWEQVKEGRGQVVLLSGEPGIGKSRLAYTLKEQVTAEGSLLFETRCSPYHQHSALYPLIEVLQRTLLLTRQETEAESIAKLERALALYGMQNTLPLFTALLSLPTPPHYPPLNLTPQKQKERTLQVMLQWVVAQAERQATASVWEDVHWADPSSLEFLSVLIDQIPTTKLLLVLTFRPEFIPPWKLRAHLTQLTLNRLGKRHVEAMIAKVAEDKELPAEVVEQIRVKTDGVPLFVEELTKSVVESVGATRASSLHFNIPATLQEALMARLDRLSSARPVAQLGAMLGREFSYELLQAVAPGNESDLQTALAKLVEAEILYQRGVNEQARYFFKHALIQDTAYQSLLKSTRQQSHQQIAQVIEARFPETVEAQPELLAHHYTEAGLIEHALPYWQQAGQRASQRSAHAEAIHHLTKGLALLQTLPDTPTRTRHELMLYLALGVPLIATKGFAAPEVESAYARARVLCQQSGETQHLFPALWGLWTFYLVRADLRTARELAEQLLAFAQSGQDPALLLQAHYALGVTLYELGDLVPASAHFEQTSALYNRQQHHSLAFLYGSFDSGVASLSFTALILWSLGYPDQALKKSQEALALAQALVHPFSLANALLWTSWLHQLRREERAAQEEAEAAIHVSTEQGFSVWLAMGMIHRGWALAVQGQGAEGLAQLRRGLADSRATGAEIARPRYLAMLAEEAYGRAGQAEEGLSVLAEALAVVNKTGECVDEAELYRLKGELTLQQFKVQGSKFKVANTQHPTPSTQAEAEAEACFHKAIEVARKQQAKSLELRATVSLARLWQGQGKGKEAHEMLAEIYGWFTEGFDTADLQEAKALLEALA